MGLTWEEVEAPA